jgi:NAD(P)-dependent dehydrogenase (short-subunit alcohol dehydrogenase family)
MSGVAVITGAASGIGAGLAREAVRRGMKVVLADLDEARLEAVATKTGGLAVPTDVTDPASLEALAERAFATGPVDLLFNNAGVLETGLSWEIPAETWRRVVDVNLLGVVNGLRAFVPRLIAANRPSRVVNTASVGGFLPSPLFAPYSATKFAVVALTESMLGELQMRKSQVRVSLLAPGPVKTGIFREPPPPASAELHAVLTGMLAQTGLTPDQFAPRVFDAIARDEYWIFPQPEALEPTFSLRNAAIAERRLPPLFMIEE